MEAAIITTYRCINECQMCHIWKHPTKAEEEFRPSLLKKLPRLSFCNVTGGEPFLRDDMEEIVDILQEKSRRVVISTNGYFTEKIVDLAKRQKSIGIRISLEGLPAINDELRGIKDGFDHGLRTLLELKRMGLKDIGFGITISDKNARDMLGLYALAKYLKVEFATAIVHNSFYFHKFDNKISNTEEVVNSLHELIRELLKTRKIKNWFRAYFNHGLIEYIRGNARLLPCTAGADLFFLDPLGDILPCNGMEEDIWFETMGNLHNDTFANIWNSDQAKKVRNMVRNCSKNCWMIGTASPAMKKNIATASKWILKNKGRQLLQRDK